MNVAFTCAGRDPQPYVLADSLIRSVRATMPGVEIVQCADKDSARVVGVDRVQRMPMKPIGLWIAEHYRELGPGDWLLADTDVIVQKDVREVFDLEFHVAVASRAYTYISAQEAQSEFMRRMPYNCGVVFSRSASVWADVANRIRTMAPHDQQWYGVQIAVADLVKAQAWRVAVLSSDYNYPPKSADDDVSSMSIVHYKGPKRKAWLLARVYQETVCA